jgi:hypothetical protein
MTVELKDGRVVGGGDFVEQILLQTKSADAIERQTLDLIVETVLTVLEISPAERMTRKRILPLANARGIICQMAFLYGHRGIDSAQRMYISGAGVTVAAQRGIKLLENNPELRKFAEQSC